MNQIKLIKNC